VSRRRYLQQILSDDPRALADCLNAVRQGDELMLADQGVQWLARADDLSARLTGLGFPVVLNALETDVALRGIQTSTPVKNVKLLNDGQWVEKVCQFDQVLSWK
jgi:sulfur relay protein TusB/DsrH